MQQELVYLNDSYCRECDARVLEVREDKFIVLDKVLFYPQGGGVPYDTGKIIRKSDNREFAVKSVRKADGVAVVEVDAKGLAADDGVHCMLDWDRRYKHMRMHTAAHILASVFFRENNAFLITGNQVDADKSRFDFSMPEFDRERMAMYVDKANEEIAKGIELRIYELPREEAFKIDGIVKLAGAFPPNISVLRIVEIPGVDIQADGGPHVRNTREIGTIEVIKLDNRGANNKRLYFALK